MRLSKYRLLTNDILKKDICCKSYAFQRNFILARKSLDSLFLEIVLKTHVVLLRQFSKTDIYILFFELTVK